MTSDHKHRYGYSVALASDGFRAECESNGDSCEILAECYGLTEKQHQTLWNDLAITLHSGVELSVWWFDSEKEEAQTLSLDEVTP